jgi:hypothetical protein
LNLSRRLPTMSLGRGRGHPLPAAVAFGPAAGAKCRAPARRNHPPGSASAASPLGLTLPERLGSQPAQLRTRVDHLQHKSRGETIETDHSRERGERGENCGLAGGSLRTPAARKGLMQESREASPQGLVLPANRPLPATRRLTPPKRTLSFEATLGVRVKGLRRVDELRETVGHPW